MNQALTRAHLGAPGRKRLSLVPALVAVGGSLALTATLIAWLSAAMDILFVLLLVILSLLLLLPVVVDIARATLDPFEPIHLFNFGYLLFFVLTPIYQVRQDGLRIVDLNPLHVEALVLAIMGLVAFYTGYYSGIFRKTRRLPRLSDEWNSFNGAFFLVSISLAGATAVYLFSLVSRVGLIEFVLRINRGDKYFIQGNSVGLGALIFLIDIVPIVGGCLLIRGSIRNLMARTLLALLVVCGAVFNLMFSGSRIHLFLALFAWATQYHYIRKRIKARAVIILAAGLVAFSTFVVIARTYLPQGGAGAAEENIGSLTSFGDFVDSTFRSGDLDFYSYFQEVIEDVPHRVNYFYGLTYLKALFTPIPRFIWPDKPENTGRIFMKYWHPLLYEQGNSAGTGILGEAYMNFGWAGIPLVLFCFGIFFRSFYTFLEVNRFNASSVLLFSSVTFLVVFESLRGEFEGGVIKGIMLGTVAWVVLRSMQVRKPVQRKVSPHLQ